MTQNYCLKRWLQILQKLQLWLGIPSIPNAPKGGSPDQGDTAMRTSCCSVSHSCPQVASSTSSTPPDRGWDETGLDFTIGRYIGTTKKQTCFLVSWNRLHSSTLWESMSLIYCPHGTWKITIFCLTSKWVFTIPQSNVARKSPQNEHA
jgi:hypothetical protein